MLTIATSRAFHTELSVFRALSNKQTNKTLSNYFSVAYTILIHNEINIYLSSTLKIFYRLTPPIVETIPDLTILQYLIPYYVTPFTVYMIVQLVDFAITSIQFKGGS